MSKFTEEKLEQAIIALLEDQGFPYHPGNTLSRALGETLLKDDLWAFLTTQYAGDGITPDEVESVINRLDRLSAADLYESNKSIHKLVADGFLLQREDRSQKDLYVQLIDYSSADTNHYRVVNQLEIEGSEKRIPDSILYINGLPLVVFEFKSAIREEATIHDAYVQLTTRYARDIPELMKYNALCVISDGVNSR
ncbi:MAG: type I restriction endonuclease, partial [Gammaproteobacteria bacterium]